MDMENLIHLFFLFFGWLLGLVTLWITERLRRRNRKQDLMTSVTGELADLQYVMASVAFLLRGYMAERSDKLLDWLIPIIRGYDGPSKTPGMVERLLKFREFPEEQRREADLATHQQGVGFGLSKYDLPFLTAQSAELSICPLDFQRGVSWVKCQLDYFNQRVDYLRSQDEKTFDTTIIGNNRVAIETNLANGYRDLATRAESIAKAIGDLGVKYQPK